jgi:hypothetical protein
VSNPITLTGEGTHWQAGLTNVMFGHNPVHNVTVISPTRLTFTTTVSFVAPAGSSALTVTTGTESVTLNGALTIVPRPQPTVAQINPDTLTVGAQNVVVNFVGRHTRWEQGVTRVMLTDPSGVTAAGPAMVESPTSMRLTLNVASTAATGPREIMIANEGNRVNPDTIIIDAGVTVAQATSGGPLMTAVPLSPGVLPGIQPAAPITLVAPNGGENWAAGQERYVGWRHRLGEEQSFDVDLSTNNGARWDNVTRGKPIPLPQLGAGVVGVKLIMPKTLVTTALIRVRAAGRSEPADISDATFNLIQPRILVLRPAVADRWVIGTSPSLKGPMVVLSHNLWPDGKFLVDLSRDGGATWQTLGETRDNRPFAWLVRGPATERARIRVRIFHENPAGAQSTYVDVIGESANFTIAPP